MDWKNLTKAEKALLQQLKDNPAWYISQRWAGYDYYLRDSNEYLQKVKSDWMNHLAPFFLKTQNESLHIDKYSLRPDAEISDTWLKSERERERQAQADKRAAKKAAIKAEQDKATAWFECDGPYTVDFSGEYFSGGGGILADGEHLMSFSAWVSSRATTFEEMMNEPRNAAHFEQIKRMVSRANRGAGLE